MLSRKLDRNTDQKSGASMKSIKQINAKNIKYIFTDIDDTLTDHGMLKASAYQALEKLSESGFTLVPVTGRPAGWCDMIARFWPIHSVIGENGAFYFSYNDKKMKREWFISEEARLNSLKKLENIKHDCLEQVPGCAVSADQFSRLFDLAIDFSEDVPALPETEVLKIKSIFEQHGATAKVSSIHVNGWFGDQDKLKMCKKFCTTELNLDLSKQNSECLFVGDSPNDEPMFGFFENSVGVANIKDFEQQLVDKPKYICQNTGGKGFVELTEHLLK